MKKHLFFAAVNADDKEKEFSSEAADFIRRGFYINDGLQSMKCAETAIIHCLQHENYKDEIKVQPGSAVLSLGGVTVFIA